MGRSRSRSPPRRSHHSRSRSPRRSRSRSPRRDYRRDDRGYGRRDSYRDYDRSDRYDRRDDRGYRGRGDGRRRGRGPVGDAKDRETSTTLFVGNLPYSFRERDLEELFDRHGKVLKATVGINKKTGQSRGYAFVEFESRKDAENALDRLTDEEVDGRRLRLDWDVGLDKKPERKSREGRGSGSPRPRSRSPRGRTPSRTPERA